MRFIDTHILYVHCRTSKTQQIPLESSVMKREKRIVILLCSLSAWLQKQLVSIAFDELNEHANYVLFYDLNFEFNVMSPNSRNCVPLFT